MDSATTVLPRRRRSGVIGLTRRLSLTFEWEPRDLWIGVFVKREHRPTLAPGVHVYVCLLPTLVLHFVWMGDRATNQAQQGADQHGTQRTEDAR